MKPISQQDQTLEAQLTTSYEQNLTKLTQFYRQRAKKHWATDGDRNTQYFQNAVLKRRMNTIVSIKDEHDVIHFKPQEIVNTFVKYFRYIFSSSGSQEGRPFMGTQPPINSHDFTYSIPDK